ncbi:MAG: hypothetical protein MJA82_18275 [Clostridia bacterium]|nr:hypothetical protein [Clostridia bacterium]
MRVLDRIPRISLFWGNKKKKDKEDEKNTINIKVEEDRLFEKNTIKDLVAPNGVNPNPLDHLVIHDHGENIYVRTFYIDKFPRRSTFAYTFEPIFSFPDSTTSVFIIPQGEGKAIRELDREITDIDSERMIAIEKGDRNRERKLSKKMNEAESFSDDVDSGENSLFEVSFITTIYAKSLAELNVKSGDLRKNSKEMGIEISAFYGRHEEAFKQNTPLNKYKIGKKHKMDRLSLSTIFHHIESEFYHDNGVVFGRNYYSGKPVSFDVYDPSHKGYGIVFAGKTHSGKSATVKKLMMLYAPHNYRFVILDVEKKGNRGEYCDITEKLNGEIFEISPETKNIMNLFEIDIEYDFDKYTRTEIPKLKLKEKCRDVKNIIMTMIKGSSTKEFDDDVFVENIVSNSIKELYREKGIYENNLDSLYTHGDKLVDGKITTGKVKKKLPELNEFYEKVLYKQSINKDDNYTRAFGRVLAGIEEYVKELYICDHCFERMEKEEYENLREQTIEKKGNNKNLLIECTHCKEGHLKEIIGDCPYFDGQSTIKIDYYTKATNIDISKLNESDKGVGQEVALNFMKVNFINKNSEDESKADPLVCIWDELHKMFPYEHGRRFVIDVYRTARKRNVSPWTISQRIADYEMYDDCIAIITNSTAMFIFKQESPDFESLIKLTGLTSSQAAFTLSAEKGEMVLVEEGKVVFVKVDLLDIEKEVLDTDMNSVKKRYKKVAS